MSQQCFFRTRMVAGLLFLSVGTQAFAASAPQLQLNRFMQEIWQTNPGIQASMAALEAAKSRKIAANQPIYNPEIGVDLETASANTITVGINQTIDWGNKRIASTSKAEAEINLATAALQGKRFAIAEEILIALVNLQSVTNLQKLARQRVDLMQEFVDNTEKREQAGDIGLQDVALARVALSEAKMQFANSAAQHARFEAQLQAAAEMFLTQWPTITQEPPVPVTSFDADTYIAKLPAIKVLMAQLAAAKSNIKLSKASTKADPSFGLNAGLEGSDPLIGLSFSMPLNIRNNYRAQIDAANQETVQIEQLLLSQTRRAQAHLRGSHRRYQLTYDAWQSWQANGLHSLNEQLELIQTIWKSGEMSTADYLVQAKQNVDAQETAVELGAQMWESWVEWLAASGQIEQWINSTK